MFDKLSFTSLARFALSAAALAALVGCDLAHSDTGSRAVRMGDFDVRYVTFNDQEIANAAPLTPLLITFTYAGHNPSNGVSVADLKRESRRLGLDMKTMRIIYGSNPYKSEDGTLHVCTIEATRQGHCKAAPTLPLKQRIAYAKRLLAQDRRCQWAGFDAAYNKKATFSLGGDDQTLNIKADC